MILFWKMIIMRHLYVHSVTTRPVKTIGGSKTAGIDERLNARYLGPQKGAEVRFLRGLPMKTLRVAGKEYLVSLNLFPVAVLRHRIEAFAN